MLDFFFDFPIHPLVVHLPIAFILFCPFLIALPLFYFREERTRKSFFRCIAIWSLLQTVSVYVAMYTGEGERERVLNRLADLEKQGEMKPLLKKSSKNHIELDSEYYKGLKYRYPLKGKESFVQKLQAKARSHELAAERVFWVSFILFGVSIACISLEGRRRRRVFMQYLSFLLACSLWILCIHTAHLGSELVYQFHIGFIR